MYTPTDAPWPVFTPRQIQLEPVHPRYYDDIYRIFSTEDIAVRYRYRGGLPAPEFIVQHLWDGVLIQKAVIARKSGQLAGLVSLYNYSPRNGIAYLAAIGDPAVTGSGLVAEGSATIIDYGFRVMDLRKIYVETLQFNLPQFAALTRIATEEGRLREHELQGGRYFDFVTLAIYREDWRDLMLDPLSVASRSEPTE
jgi:RimJ/RimL family protein N-acetyltransferase